MLAINIQKIHLGTNGWQPRDVIFEASFRIQDGLISWIAESDWDFQAGGQTSEFFFSCLRLYWRPVEGGLGRRVRLGNQHDYDPELEALINP